METESWSERGCGGRIGNALALDLSAVLIVALGGWRHVLWLHGAAGIVITLAAWLVLGDAPDCAHAASRRPGGFPFRALATHSHLWLFALAQFCVNFGAAPSITWLPAYLQDALHVPGKEASRLLSFALFAGLAGLPLGGILADWSPRRWGVGWGRRVFQHDARLARAGADGGRRGCGRVFHHPPDGNRVGDESGYRAGAHGRDSGVDQWARQHGRRRAAAGRAGDQGRRTGAIAWPMVFTLCLAAYALAALIALQLDPRRALKS